ncbi:MAG: HAD-IIB family hydrolase [Syntrophales bacterium]|nr:HAD-IIB family hydrolase [Syntrophales bacterium]
MKLVIFSDLDGSLLNYDDYSFEEARPALEKIRRWEIPLILTTSKTRAEVEIILGEMGFEEPFIIENGAALFFPAGYRGWDMANGIAMKSYGVMQLGMPYAEIRTFVKRMTPRFKIRGFGDCSVQEIADMTGLPYDKAVLAKEREFTEPFLLGEEKDIEDLKYLASKDKIKIVRGGMFYHFMGIHQDKGEAVKITKSIFRRRIGEEVRFVGIGDSANDIPMLEHVDIPVLIPHADGRFEHVDLPNLTRAGSPGSKGWNEVVEGILDDFERRCD